MFPGYAGVWEQHKLSDVASITMGQSPDGSTYSTTPQGHILIQGNADLSHGWVSPRVWTTQVTKTCDAGDIIMSVRAPAGAIGRTQYNAVIGRGVAAIKGNDFIYQSLARMNDIGYWRSLVTGSTFESINSTDLKNADLCVPSLAEQRKIGSFFHKLDDLLALHQRQTEKLRKLKQGLLQNMFPRDGESVPRLRFPGFTTTWKQQKVEELMDVTSVKRIHQSDWTTSGVPFLRARDIVARSKHEKITDPLFISQEKYDEYSAISGKVKLGDLLVTGVGTIGIPLLITDDKPIYFKDGNIIWFKNINNTVDGYFLYYAFCQKKVQSFINQAAGKGTVATYTISTAKSTPLVLPSSRNEQQKIGSFFHHFDDLINLHEQYVTTLKHLKKGLLQKMFPQD